MSDESPPILNYANADVGRLVPITLYRSELEIHMAASKLEGEGIRATIEDHPRTGGGIRAARILVAADDAPAAIAILKQTPAHAFLV